MKVKSCILVFMFILMSASAFGLDLNITQDNFNRANGALGTATNGNAWWGITGSPGINTNQGQWSASGQNGKLNFSEIMTANDSICYSVDNIATANNGDIYLYKNITTYLVRMSFISTSSQIRIFNGSSSNNIMAYLTATWYNICIKTISDSQFKIYVNGVDKGKFNNYLNVVGFTKFIRIEQSSANNVYYDNITLVNSTAATQTYPTNKTISAKKYWNNVSITTFNASVRYKFLSNSSFKTSTYGTTSSTITQFASNLSGCYKLMTATTYGKISCLINITYFSTGTYFNRTYTNVNISTNHIGYLKQSQINFFGRNSVTNISYTNFTIRLNKTIICTTTTQNNCTGYPNAGLYVVELRSNVAGGFHPSNTSKYINALVNGSMFLYAHEHKLNIRVRDRITNASISSFTVNLSSLNRTDVRYNSTTTGLATFGVVHDTYHIFVDSTNYASNSTDLVINTGDKNYTFYLYKTNSINLTFIDVLTGSIINTVNLTVEFIGATSQTNITDTGSLFVSLFQPSDYTIVTSGSGYVQNTYLFTLLDDTFNPLTIYMQPSVNTTYYVLFTVIDKLSRQPLQGAKVTIQRYVNNAWVTEQIYTTDFNGRGQGYFVLNTEYYNFVIEYNGITYSGVLNSDANKKIIYYQDYLNGLGIELNLASTSYINTIQDLYSVNTGLRYVNLSNSTGYFIYKWQDVNGNPRNGTLKVYVNNLLNCSTSGYGATGNINCFVNSSNQELFYSAYTWIDGVPDKTMTQKVGVSSELNFSWGIGGWIFTIFLVLIAFTAFAQVPAISVLLGSVFFALALFFNLLFNPDAGLSQYGIVIVFVAFLIAKIPSNSGVNS